MARTHTRTHTSYFDSDLLEVAEKAVENMLAEWSGRAEYLAGDRHYVDIILAGNHRAALLRSALAVAKDPAD